MAAGFVLGALLAAPSVARAECTAAYTSSALVNDLTTLQLALRNLDEASFGDAGKRLEAGIPCVSNPVPPMVFASAYRYIGAYQFLQQNNAAARKWFRSSLELDPSYQWDANELELDNPMRSVFEEERQSALVEPTPVAGRLLSQPAGSTFSLDGRPLTVAAASADRPHILQQVATADKSVRGTWLIEGNAFPEQVLQDASVSALSAEEAAAAAKVAKKQEAVDKKKKEKVDSVEYTDSGAMKIERMRPPEKTPLIVAGAVAVAGAGAIYAASFATHEEFENSGTTAELKRTQSLTNTLVLSSGGLLLAGLGIGYWGVVLDGGAGVGIHGTF